MTKVLVIEDEDILRGEVIEWLTLEDYEAMGASDGVDGVEAAENYQPDLIICDITMPRLDGYGVLLRLRADPATAHIPFIFVTARAAHEDIRQGMRLGADDYITKPFTRLELLDAILARLAKKTRREQEFQVELTQWQAAFEQEREMRLLKAKLVGMFSHDFRNPLAGIMAASNLLREYGDAFDPERRVKYFNRIEALVKLLTQMLDDLLLVVQMETGNLEFNPAPLDIDLFVQHIVQEFSAIHSESHSIVFESQITELVTADERLLRQIASNLISNAIKYSPAGGEIRVSLSSDQQNIMFSVQDQGIGISPEDQNRLFQEFQRGSNVGQISGTGLGLAIVRQAADLHSGSIALESEVGQGTVITVTFPAE